MTDRYGNRRVPKMREQWNAHRDACRAEGTPAVQETLNAVEQWIDFAFGVHGAVDNQTKAALMQSTRNDQYEMSWWRQP